MAVSSRATLKRKVLMPYADTDPATSVPDDPTFRHVANASFLVYDDDTLIQPNGVAFSPDYRTLYLTDTGAGEVVISPSVSPVPPPRWNSIKPHTVCAYDVSPSGTYLRNKRPIHHAMEYVPDGIKVSREGYVLTATGCGIDVLTSRGTPLVRVLTNFTVVNVAWMGRGEGGDTGKFWAVGWQGGEGEVGIKWTGCSRGKGRGGGQPIKHTSFPRSGSHSLKYLPLNGCSTLFDLPDSLSILHALP